MTCNVTEGHTYLGIHLSVDDLVSGDNEQFIWGVNSRYLYNEYNGRDFLFLYGPISNMYRKLPIIQVNENAKL